MWVVRGRQRKRERESEKYMCGKKRLTTFCLNSSSLSHFNLVTSCRRPSTRESLFGASQQHMLQGLPLGVSADDMLSKPVSLSTAPAMPRPSSSTLFNDDESLSDMATRLAPLRKHKISQRLRPTVSTTIISAYAVRYIIVWWTYLEVLCTGWMSGLDIGDEGELFLLFFDNDLPNCKMKHVKKNTHVHFVSHDDNSDYTRNSNNNNGQVWFNSRSVWTRRPNSC